MLIYKGLNMTYYMVNLGNHTTLIIKTAMIPAKLSKFFLSSNGIIGHGGTIYNLSESFIFQYDELTIEKTGVKVPTNRICGIQKINNNNKPNYEIVMGGVLKEIS
jgi:hypothetical protein